MQPAAGTFLAALDDGDAETLRSLGTMRRYAPGAALFWEGEESSHVAVVLAGRVKVAAAAADGTEALLAVRGPGELLGELAVLDGAPRSATATALDAVAVRLIDGVEFEQFLATRPGAAVALLHLLVRRLRESGRRRAEFGSQDVAARLAGRLLELADEHGEPDGDGIRVTVPLTQDDLAGMVGASRESVARALRTLREAGLVATGRRSITVVDPTRLRRRGP